MTNMTGRLLNGIMMCLTIVIWVSLSILAVIQLFKKNYFNFKKTILYLLNSSILYFGVPFYVRLAIVVQGPKAATKQDSMMILKNDCVIEFIRFVGISFLISTILLAVNYLYQKYILKKIEKNILIFLTVIDFSLLLILSVLAIFNYYIALSGEIDSYHH